MAEVPDNLMQLGGIEADSNILGVATIRYYFSINALTHDEFTNELFYPAPKR